MLEIDFDRMFARWAQHAVRDPAAIRARFSFGEFYVRHERDPRLLTFPFSAL